MHLCDREMWGPADACLVPDFRSSNGLFNSLKSQHNLKSSGKDLFDASVYKDGSSTSSFHDMVRSLWWNTRLAKPTAFHHLLATLAQEGRLLRLYTQNVDDIDTSLPPLATEVPLGRKGPWPKTVQLHGGLAKMVCAKCNELSSFEPELFYGPVPPACKTCQDIDTIRTEHAGKRSHGVGKLRPRMVLYTEDNPDAEAIGSVVSADLRTRPDAVIVVGTSMKIPGVKRITREMCGVVRDRRDGVAIWLNKDPEPAGKEFEDCWDIVVKGSCDDVAKHACMRKWNEEDVSKEITDEEFRKIKEGSSQVEVQIISPRKKRMSEIVEGIPTPTASPRLAPQMVDELSADANFQVPSTPTKPRKTKQGSNPASKGRSIASLLAPAKSIAKTTSRAKTGAAKKRSTAAPAKDTKINTAFKVTKSVPPASKNATKFSSQPAKATTMNSKSVLQAQTNIKKAHAATESPLPMQPISPRAAVNNTSLPHKIVEGVKSLFPNLGKRKRVDNDERGHADSTVDTLPADLRMIMNA